MSKQLIAPKLTYGFYMDFAHKLTLKPITTSVTPQVMVVHVHVKTIRYFASAEVIPGLLDSPTSISRFLINSVQSNNCNEVVPSGTHGLCRTMHPGRGTACNQQLDVLCIGHISPPQGVAVGSARRSYQFKCVILDC